MYNSFIFVFPTLLIITGDTNTMLKCFIDSFGGVMTISEEKRERVVQAYLSGKGSMPYIADMFGVSLPLKNGC